MAGSQVEILNPKPNTINPKPIEYRGPTARIKCSNLSFDSAWSFSGAVRSERFSIRNKVRKLYF